MLCGTVQLWQWCHLCVIYDKCLLIQCMWLMQPLSGAIQYVMDQSQIDPVYWLMGRMLGSLMSDSRWPVGPVISLQCNTTLILPKGSCFGAESIWESRGEKQLVRKIGLVAFMFFFELLFSYVSSQFPSMFPLLTYSQSFLFPYLLTIRDTQDEGEARFDSNSTGNSLKIILWLRNLSRFPNWPLDPMVDLY